MSTERFFVQVECQEFRRRMNIEGARICRSGYETVIYDDADDILGIMHAASIDERGRCHPTEYFLRRTEPYSARLGLVA